MTEGISKEALHCLLKLLENHTLNGAIDFELVKRILINNIEELDPWLPIDENTPKEQDLLITDKSKRKYIGRLFSSGIWCIQGKLDFIPTHYKLLTDDPK